MIVTFNLNADDGSVYADTAAWVAAHGLCGTENLEFVTEGTITQSSPTFQLAGVATL